MAESLEQADEFGTDHFQLYENQADAQKLEQIFNKKSRRKPNGTKTGVYEN